MAVPGGTVETLENIPPHVWRGLPDDMRLRKSAVNQNRIGVWASKPIPKGKRFGPFVGERKKRSQVTSNVFMWEVYFPAWGWMCVDATDPMKGNWLRYVNWARSAQEQNLFPLEINRAIYYKVLKPIGPGEELLVWYNGEDNPEITAAIEEERVSSLGKKNSPRTKRARRKLLDKARQAGLGGFRGPKQTCGTRPVAAMRDSEDGLKDFGDPSSSSGLLSQEKTMSEPSPALREDTLPTISVSVEEEGELDSRELAREPLSTELELPSIGTSSIEAKPAEDEQLHQESNCQGLEEDSVEVLEQDAVSIPLLPKPDPDSDPSGQGEPQGESYFPCQHCERHFTTKQGLERHTHIHVTANHQTHTFKCRYCGKYFGSQIGRRRHERRHENGPKKRPGSLAGTAAVSSSLLTECSNSDLVSTSDQLIIISSQNSVGTPNNSEADKQGTEANRAFVSDENKDSKELHLCKYCKKAFGTHTNMRRHQRRIHERHLLPKGVRRKGMFLQDGQSQQRQPAPPPAESPSASPPPVYVPSADAEDEVDQEEDYMVDISSNISENLSLYIDGKILSTSTVSTCEVIEVDSSSATLFGLDAMIISPDKITQALKVETTTCAVKEIPNAVQSVAKRRTSTPPLLPKIKMESSESDAVVSSASSSSSFSSSLSSSSSSSSSSLAGGLFSQATETFAFQKEKTVYLSPKLKQLLQTQDSQKPVLTLIPEGHRLVPSVMPVTSLPATSGRFKRRTASPPNSPQLSPVHKGESSKAEAGVLFTLKVPKLEGHCRSPAWSLSSKDERDTTSPSGVDTFKTSHGEWSASRSAGSSCNQQPLDLSSAVSKKNDGLTKSPGEVVLDLSMHRKSSAELETKGSSGPQPLTKKRKPNTSMLEKVLMNEYAGLDPTGEDSLGCAETLSAADSVVSPDLSCALPEGLSFETALHPPPPSLTPVIMNPPSPSNPALASPTPPPPVLPSVSSPLPLSESPQTVSSNSPMQCSLPVLSPKTSPRPTELGMEEGSPSPICGSNATQLESLIDVLIPVSGDTDPVSKHSKATPDPVILQPDLKPSNIDIPQSETSAYCKLNVVSSSNNLVAPEPTAPLECLVDTSSANSVILDPVLETEGELQPLSPPQSLGPPVLVAALPEPPSSSLSLPTARSESPPLLALSPSPLVATVIKEEPLHMDEPATAGAPVELSEQETFCKTFVCNVCEGPFRSMKELSRHITEHAVEWPFKCEFCLQLFENATALLEHRSSLHGVGRIYVCCTCTKEFAFHCNLQQHQKDLHPGLDCAHTVVENGKLRPQNYTDPNCATVEYSPSAIASDKVDGASQVAAEVQQNNDEVEKKEEEELDDSTEELYTTIKIMASEGGKPRGPDVRLGINQHYPSFKPPPFPYHNRTPAGSVASATNFTTHNIPQTFSTAIRCTKCGKSFDNMPELHKHILACANASDKRRYTPKKNPIPLRQIAKPHNGALSPVVAANAGHSAFRRMGQPKRLNFSQEPSTKMKLSVLNKKKNQLVQKAISQRNKSAAMAKKVAHQPEEEQEIHVCPHCSREFTYLGSLNKHVAVSCPMKPVSKKARKSGDEHGPQDKNGNLRRRTADSDIKQESEVEPKILGKTRARSSGPAETSSVPLKPLPSKGRMAALQVRPKRPASLQASSVPLSKKSKKANAPTQQHTLPSSPPAASSTQRLVVRMQRGGKEKVVAVKSQQLLQLQPKKEGRFSVKTRERVGGPVTRSLQLANTTGQPEVRTEDLSCQDPRESQEPLLKMAR